MSNVAHVYAEEPMEQTLSERIQVVAKWDNEASVWVAESEQVPGLVAEADSLDELMPCLDVLIPEMLELNGLGVPAHDHRFDYHVVLHVDRTAELQAPA